MARGFVKDLCFALVHRVELERLFLILTSYIDESGTHAGAPAMTMGAILGNVSQWAKFQHGFDKIKRKYGFRILHTKELVARSGEFRGWHPEKCAGLIRDVAALIAVTTMCGSKFSITDEIYGALIADRPPKLRLDSKYGFCFRNCLNDHIVQIDGRLGHHKKFHETRLHVVVEAGHKNAGDAERIFHETKKELGAASPILASIVFAAKDESDPLMMADFLAYSAYLEKANGSMVNPPIKSARKEKSSLVNLDFTLEGIKLARAGVQEKFETRRAWGISKRRPEPSSQT